MDTTVINKIQGCNELRSMIGLFVNFLWTTDSGTMLLVLLYIEKDYNFIAYRIRREYQLSHKVITSSNQEQSGECGSVMVWSSTASDQFYLHTKKHVVIVVVAAAVVVVVTL